ncbi:MAG TPA: DUF4412 domain-containing protein [Candidatus Acidoferrales bacterium]|jgi:hypothetical protein|nr:DUF4412 domain-containing protein [Candidatus Acidoferrales bacterium]
MKKSFILTTLTVMALALTTAPAQSQRSGGGSGGSHFGAAFAKLFGANQTFSARLEIETPNPSSGQPMTIPGKMSFDTGKSRFEMNISDIKGAQMPPQLAAQMKQMGMDSVVSISRPDKKLAYVIYNGMQSYIETPLTDKADTATVEDFTAEVTELGKDTVDGHDCVKNKVVVSDKEGTKHESTVWNAKDLKNFPVKIEATEQGRTTVMSFKDVSFKKPDAGDFEAPAAFTKYASPQALQQAVMAKQISNGGLAHPPGQ